MLTTVEGIYRNGHVELMELPENISQQATEAVRVIITFLPPSRIDSHIDLRTHQIDEAQAAELRARLQSFTTEWDDAEMNIYDDYETNLASLSAR